MSEQDYTIDSLVRAVRVLQELARAGGPVGVSELSRNLDIHKNNAFRIAETLIGVGFVKKDPTTSGYMLDAGVMELAMAYLATTSHTLVSVSQAVVNGSGVTGFASAGLVVKDGEETDVSKALQAQIAKLATALSTKKA